MRHRAEIDGLRAVAVIPVILFHAGFSAFSGGFIGVDVFFVISGYLITGIIVEEIGEGRFSLLNFYERRARRILPALFVVLMACLPFAWMWLLDEQLESFAASLGASLVFLSNFFFLSQVDYFAPAAELQPLLHTWSLSVEEQYYLVFPLIVGLSLKRGLPRLMAVVFVLTIASLAISEAGIRLNAERNFFFTLSRFWELGLGSLCALAVARWGERTHGPLALFGLAMILSSVFTFDEELPFAGLYALLPVCGAMLVVLFARSGTLAVRLLSSPILVGIGLISYSSYLVHQPLFAFARIRSPDELGTLQLAGLSLASLALGWLSWRFVERPFRGARPIILPGRKALFGSLSAVASVLMVVSVTLWAGQGFPGRMAERFAGDLGDRHFFADVQTNYFPCTPKQIRDAAPTYDGRPRCMQSHAEGPVTVVVVGDSHAEHLFPGVADGLPDETVAYYQQNDSAPFLTAPGMPAIYAEIERNAELKAVIFAMHWPRRFNEVGDEALFRDELRDTLGALTAKGVTVLVAGDLPWFVSEPHACKFEVFPGNLRYCTVERQEAVAVRSVYEAALDEVAEETGARVVPLRDLFCDKGACSMVLGDVVQFRDRNHLTAAGGRLAGGRLADAYLATLAP